MASESGLILIKKPRGITSFGVVSRLRKLTGVRRIGHTGTLDPFADGLLPVCIGRTTSIVQFMDGYDKTYRLGIVFGRATDTQDLTGETVFEHILTEEEIHELLSTDFAVLHNAVAMLPGDRMQTPPMFSAVKVDGRKLYEYARQGCEVERKERPIRIDRAVVEAVGLADGILQATILIGCSKGTYIRTIADELGKQLGFGAHAASLTRLKCGPFSLDQALDLEELFSWRADLPDQPAFLELLRQRGLLLPAERAFTDFPILELPESSAIRLINGQPLILEPDFADRSKIPAPGSRAAVFSSGSLIGIASLLPDAGGGLQIKTERVLIDLADFRQS